MVLNKIRPDTIFVSLGNLRYGPFFKMAAGGHFEFLETHIISNYSPKSKCNTSKLVDFKSINPFFWFWGKKIYFDPRGASKRTKNDPKIEKIQFYRKLS